MHTKKHTEEYINKAFEICKGLVFLFITAIFGICSYMVSNFHTLIPTQFIISIAGLVFLSVVLCIIAHRLKKMMDALDNLEKK